MQYIQFGITLKLKMLLKIVAVLLIISQLVFGQLRIDPLVESHVGLIRGLHADDGDYSMFLGIPFGKVNLDNPFSASEPYPNFEDVYEANDDLIVCPQIEEFNNTIVGSLDCLRLNVYVPHSATSTNRLPVLVWIYGGGFRRGFNNRYLYGPKYLVRHDIILVTINYRLGAYGFMCLDTPEIPGNQGIKDQLLALRWIKKNIGAFGGDDNKITIFGESAGSISVDLHLTSNNEKLFDKIILQSGTLLTPIIQEHYKTAPQMLANHLGYETDNMDDALNFLAKTKTDLVIAATDDLGMHFNLRQCIEKEFEGVENIITDNWITADLPKVNRMPIIIGITNDERYESYLSEEDEFYQNLDVVQAQLAKGFDINSNDFDDEMQDIVHHYYFGDNEMSAAIRRDAINLESDFMYNHPTTRSIQKFLNNKAGNIFFYVFSYVGNRNLIRYRRNITSGSGALHADELGYQFDISFMQDDPLTPEDERVIDQMSLLWSNFVKYGDPTPEISDLLPVKWTPVTDKVTLPYLEIGSELKLGFRPFRERMSFWDLFYSANEKHQIPYPGAKVDL